jgi:hypothetical protein
MGRGQPSGMMIIRVSPTALPHLRPALRPACPARSVIGLQGCGVARAAARDRRASPHSSAAPAGLGRPRGPRRTDPAPAGKSCGCTGWSLPALSCGGIAVWPSGSGPTRTGQDGRRSAPRSPPSSNGLPPRNHDWGIQEDPRRASQARPPGQRIHHPPGPQGAEDPSGTGTAHRARRGGSSCRLRHRRCSPPISPTWTAR